jgi:hypothetical protein
MKLQELSPHLSSLLSEPHTQENWRTLSPKTQFNISIYISIIAEDIEVIELLISSPRGPGNINNDGITLIIMNGKYNFNIKFYNYEYILIPIQVYWYQGSVGTGDNWNDRYNFNNTHTAWQDVLNHIKDRVTNGRNI